MNAYDDYLLLTDMDGTLIGSDHRISEKNLAAIRYFTKRGGRFAVATGRTQKNCVPYMEGLAINAPCIFYNGGMLYDWNRQTLLKALYLQSPVRDAFVRQCMAACSTLCVQIYTHDTIYVVNDPAYDDEKMVAEKQEFVHALPEDLCAYDWIKLLLADKRENLLLCSEIATACGFHKTANSFFSSPVYLEFVGSCVSKGDMLDELVKMDGLRHKTVVAAGDFHNDIEMLRRADCGIAPANAQPEVRDAADIIAVGNDEDLLHHIIYTIIPDLDRRSASPVLR